MNLWHISQQEMGTLVKCEIFVQNVFEVNICLGHVYFNYLLILNQKFS